MRHALTALTALLALSASTDAQALSFKRIRINPTKLIASDEICDNNKDDDGDGAIDEEPCIQGDLFGGFDDRVGTNSGPGGSTFIPWDNWLVAFDDNDGTLSVYELYSESTDKSGEVTAVFQRVVSDLDTFGLARSASEVTVGTADTTGDGNEELVLGFADYSGGVIVTYTPSSSRELTAGQYDNYLFSSGSSNVVTDSTVDSANGTFLLDTGYTDYYGEGVGFWKLLNADVLKNQDPSLGSWVYLNAASGYTHYY